ncbi:putative reverse transcriptase domain-containing protein [Tanacetum coccineum]
MTDARIKALISQGVANALAEIKANQTSRNGNDSHDSGTGSRRIERAARECTYTDFLKCQPLNFKGTEGVLGLTQWFKKMESVFHISNYNVACQIKFKTLKKMMTDKYCPRGEIKKLEIEMWNLKVKGTDVMSYSQCFQELALMCGRMFPEESDEIEKYVGGLPDMIHGSVMASKPKTMQDAIKFATELMDQKIRTIAERQAENKRKQDENFRNNQNQQQNKRQNTGRAYTARPSKKREFSGNANTGKDQRATRANQKGIVCYECGAQGHFKRECPKMNNKNHGNQGVNSNALA